MLCQYGMCIVFECVCVMSVDVFERCCCAVSILPFLLRRDRFNTIKLYCIFVYLCKRTMCSCIHVSVLLYHCTVCFSDSLIDIHTELLVKAKNCSKQNEIASNHRLQYTRPKTYLWRKLHSEIIVELATTHCSQWKVEDPLTKNCCQTLTSKITHLSCIQETLCCLNMSDGKTGHFWWSHLSLLSVSVAVFTAVLYQLLLVLGTAD